jgi:uncharacterized oxidoreductase
MIFQHTELEALTSRIFEAAGCDAEEAGRVALRLVSANLVGHDSHGVLRVTSYVQWLQAGKVLPNIKIRTEFENEVIAVVDGQFGLGQTVGEQATQLGIAKCSKHGVAAVSLKNAGHLGRIGDWAQMASEAGKMSLCFVNTSGAGMLVAPFGGIDRRLSANPFAAAVPTQDGSPILLDMSACTIAEGKIRVALNRGSRLPDGCIIDSNGQPTNDPHVFYSDPPGAILPIAGHKGSGLSLIIEFLAGALGGGTCTNPVNAGRVSNGMLSIFIDPGVFSAESAFYSEVTRFVAFVKTSRTVTDDGEILMPGEIEERTRAQRLANGIELDDTTWAELAQTCRGLGVTHDYPVPDLDTSKARGGLTLPGVEDSPT